MMTWNDFLKMKKQCRICDLEFKGNQLEAQYARWSWSQDELGDYYWHCPVCHAMVTAGANASREMQDTYGT